MRLYSRPGNELTYRFPLIVETLARLRSLSCIIDGEAVCCGDKGVPSFDRIRCRRHDGRVFLFAFDLIEVNGDDRRRDPLQQRKLDLSRLVRRVGPGGGSKNGPMRRCGGVIALMRQLASKQSRPGLSSVSFLTPRP